MLIFYSGHGTQGGKDGKDGAALTLLDGQLTREMLYDEVLRLCTRATSICSSTLATPRRCCARATARPDRDTHADETAQYLRSETMARFPHVGAVVASTAGAQAHEWDAYGAGIFTHELLSALRGAADVDGNGRIEYSEIAAFITAANRAIADPRARRRSSCARRRWIRARRSSIWPTCAASAFCAGRRRRWVPSRSRTRTAIASWTCAPPRSEGRTGSPRRRHALLADRARGIGHPSDAAGDPGPGDIALCPGRDPHARCHGYGAATRTVRDRVRPVLLPRLRRSFGRSARGGSARARRAGRYGHRCGGSAPPAPGRQGGGDRVGRAGLGAGILGAVAWQARSDFDGTTLEARAARDADRYRLAGTLAIAGLVAAAISGGLAGYLLARDSPQ